MENFEKIILPWQDWKIVNYLGSGAYGKVYEIERNASGIQEKAALKIVTRPKDAGELEADYQNGYDKESISAKYTQIFQEYRNEYKLMKELQGQSNIVSCDDFFIEEKGQNLYPYGTSDLAPERNKGAPFAGRGSDPAWKRHLQGVDPV